MRRIAGLLTLLGVAALVATSCSDGTGSGDSVGNGNSDGPQLGVEIVARGIDNPVHLSAPDGDPRLFVVEHAVSGRANADYGDHEERNAGEARLQLAEIFFPIALGRVVGIQGLAVDGGAVRAMDLGQTRLLIGRLNVRWRTCKRKNVNARRLDQHVRSGPRTHCPRAVIADIFTASCTRQSPDSRTSWPTFPMYHTKKPMAF